jgi:hypothetical protein
MQFVEFMLQLFFLLYGLSEKMKEHLVYGFDLPCYLPSSWFVCIIYIIYILQGRPTAAIG